MELWILRVLFRCCKYFQFRHESYFITVWLGSDSVCVCVYARVCVLCFCVCVVFLCMCACVCMFQCRRGSEPLSFLA